MYLCFKTLILLNLKQQQFEMDIGVGFHSPQQQRYGNINLGFQDSNGLDTELFSYQYSVSTRKRTSIKTNVKKCDIANPYIEQTAEFHLISIQSCAQQNTLMAPNQFSQKHIFPKTSSQQQSDDFFQNFHQNYVVKFQTQSSIEHEPVQRILGQNNQQIEKQTPIQQPNQNEVKINKLASLNCSVGFNQSASGNSGCSQSNKNIINLHINKIRGQIKKRIAFKSVDHLYNKVKFNLQSSLIINESKYDQKQSLIKNPNIFSQFERKVSPQIFRKNNSINTSCLMQTFNPRINRSWKPSPPLSSRGSNKQNIKMNMFRKIGQINNPQQKSQQAIAKVKKMSKARKQLRQVSYHQIDKNIKFFQKLKNNSHSKNLFQIEPIKIQKFRKSNISKY